RMAKLPAEESTFFMFERIVSHLPQTYGSGVSVGIASLVDAFFISWAEKDRLDAIAVSRFLDQGEEACRQVGSYVRDAERKLCLGETAAARALLENAKKA